MEKLHEPATERRRMTRNSIYRYLYAAPEGRSKQDIADDLALSLPTVHQNLTELLKAGLVRTDGMSESTGGRRAMRPIFPRRSAQRCGRSRPPARWPR